MAAGALAVAVLVVVANGAWASFTAATGSPFGVGFQPMSVAIGDFDGVNGPDLAVANFSDHSVTVLLNDGAGGFSPALGSPFVVGHDPISVAVGGGAGDDTLVGGDGDDDFFAGAGTDSCTGGAGTNTDVSGECESGP